MHVLSARSPRVVIHQWRGRQAALTNHNVAAAKELAINVHLRKPAHNDDM
jgi:hypothetical protein